MIQAPSVARRPLDFEDYLSILRRNIGWVIGPVFAGLVVSTVVAYMIQDIYVSKALIRIVPQQISESYVQTTASEQLSDHVNAMAQTILSRNTLTNLINTYGLYKTELNSEPLEDVIEKMRQSISIRPVVGVTSASERSVPAMQVAFSYRDRYLAQKACQDLVSRFMNENNVDALDNEVATNQFLNDEVDRAKHDLDVLEQKLADFRARNAGRLPEEMEMNVSQMNALESRANTLSEQASRNNEQRMVLESDLRIAKDRLNSIKDITPQTQARNEHLIELDRQIQALETSIADMKERYTENFPDLQNAQQQLLVLKRQRDEAAKEKPAAADNQAVNASVSRERLDAQAAIQLLQTQLKANAIEGQQINRELQAVNTHIRNYQTRVEGVPAGEKEYGDLIRDRDLAKQRYAELEIKREKSAVSVDMERRKQGETLEVLDQASLPATPTKPQRALIIPIGAVAGLVIAFILVAIRELRDASLKNLKDVRLYTQLPILGNIPLLEDDLVLQRRKQVMWIGWATAAVAGLAIIGGSIAHYYLTKA